MSVQNTFTLIPQFSGRADTPERGRGPVRPMTSKQVQKAYKAANRMPRMSRVEQRKHERAEQERIRKEFEKEKSAAKARAARDKKKEKEAAERETKRKKGLPLVTVNPSQDTIAWFVRGPSVGKKRSLGGSETKPTGGLAPIQEMPPPPRPSAKNTEPNELEEAPEDDLDSDMPARKRQFIEPELPPVNMMEPVEDLPLPHMSPPITSPQREQQEQLDRRKEDVEKETSEEEIHVDVVDARMDQSKVIEAPPTRPTPTPWRMELNDLDVFQEDSIDLDSSVKLRSLENGMVKAFEASEPLEEGSQPLERCAQEAETDNRNPCSGKASETEVIERLSPRCQTFHMGDAPNESGNECAPEPPMSSMNYGDDLDDLDEESLLTAEIAWEACRPLLGQDVQEDSTEAHIHAEPPPSDTRNAALPQVITHETGPGESDENFSDDIDLDMLQGLEAMMEGNIQSEAVCTTRVGEHPSQTRPDSPNTRQLSRTRSKIEEDLGLQIPAEPPSPTFKVPAIPQRHRQLSSSPPPPRQAPPLSTQAIFLNFDEFFPSPSQQARELEDEQPLTQPTPVRPPKRSFLEREREPQPDLLSAHQSQSEHRPRAESEQEPSSPSPPQRRFFTSSGSSELMALAMQRSRRTAALEELHHKEQARMEAGFLAKEEAAERARKNHKMSRAFITKTAAPASKPRAPTFLTKGVQKAATVKSLQLSAQLSTARPRTTPPTKQNNKVQIASTECIALITVPEADKENISPLKPSASQESEYGGDWVDEIALELMP